MTLLNKVFTTGTLVKIILVLTAVVAMKAVSLHYDLAGHGFGGGIVSLGGMR